MAGESHLCLLIQALECRCQLCIMLKPRTENQGPSDLLPDALQTELFRPKPPVIYQLSFETISMETEAVTS